MLVGVLVGVLVAVGVLVGVAVSAAVGVGVLVSAGGLVSFGVAVGAGVGMSMDSSYGQFIPDASKLSCTLVTPVKIPLIIFASHFCLVSPGRIGRELSDLSM